jgi:hypothetical protein
MPRALRAAASFGQTNTAQGAAKNQLEFFDKKIFKNICRTLWFCDSATYNDAYNQHKREFVL